jgi:hypothetical protein
VKRSRGGGGVANQESQPDGDRIYWSPVSAEFV